MRRTTILIPEDLAAALEREADRRGVSASAVACDALASHLGLDAVGDRNAPSVATVGRSGQHTTARNMEELLQDEWGERARHR